MPEDIIALITALAGQESEDECLEFKQGNTDPDRIGRDIAALANSAALHGRAYAYKVWGIDDATHELTGTGFNPKTTKVGNQELELWLRQHLSENAEFMFERVKANDRHLVLLRVWPATYRPVLWKGIAYIRTGSSTQELRHGSRREQELWRCTSAEVFELQVARNGLTGDEVLGHLDIEAFREGLDVPAAASSTEVIHLLESERLISSQPADRYAVTNLGAILFARDIDEFPTVARKALRVIQYDGASPIAPSRSRTFTQGYARLDQMLDYIEALLPQTEVLEGARRVTQRAYPHVALREILANMLIHQDLSVTGAGPMVSIFDGRIEFTNPGRSLVDVPRLLNDPPRSRNEHLAALCRRMGLCEEAGAGWDRIVLACETAHIPAPEVEEPGDNMRVMLHSRTAWRDLTTQQRMDAAYWHACAQYAQHQPMTNATLRARLDLPANSAAQVSRLIKTCLDHGILKPADPDASKRYAHYLPYWA